MPASPPPSPRIDLLNAWGRDEPVDWRGGLTPPGTPGHPPINYWAWPAATGGRFHQRPDTVDGDADAVVLLLRWRGFSNLRALRQLKARGLRVFVSWKESGEAQIARQIRWPWWRALLRRVLAEADGAIATSEPAAAHYAAHGARRVHRLPTPYPFDCPDWDFALPFAQRAGLLVGTRQFEVPERRHAEALAMAGRLARAGGCPVTVFNLGGAEERARALSLLGAVPRVDWIERRLAYPDWLRTLARHRLVLQRDSGWVPGQVAGDALLAGIVNVGGNGATQRLAFPALSEPELDEPALEQAALALLLDDAACRAAAEAGRRQAHAAGLSFAASRARWAAVLAGD